MCQSCGMPLTAREDYGTDRGGRRNDEYCRYCFVDGRFTDPGISLHGMTELCVNVMTRRGMREDEARAMMSDLLPRLKRWQADAPVSAR
jgi:hypothetical protein